MKNLDIDRHELLLIVELLYNENERIKKFKTECSDLMFDLHGELVIAGNYCRNLGRKLKYFLEDSQNEDFVLEVAKDLEPGQEK